MTTTDDLIQFLERTVEHYGTDLSGDLRSLGERLIRVADSIDKDPSNAIINGLGEVGAQGAHIDSACGRYREARDNLKATRSFLSDEERV